MSPLVEAASTLSWLEAKTKSFPSGETVVVRRRRRPRRAARRGLRASGPRAAGAAEPRSSRGACAGPPSRSPSGGREAARRRGAFVFDFSRSLNFFSWQAASAQSGKTSEVKTNAFPSGDQSKPSTPSGSEVALTGSPPVKSSSQICDVRRRGWRGTRALPVRRELGSRIALLAAGQPAGLASAAGTQPDRGAARFSSTSGVRDGIGDPLPVGRDGEAADPLDARELVEAERPPPRPAAARSRRARSAAARPCCGNACRTSVACGHSSAPCSGFYT